MVYDIYIIYIIYILVLHMLYTRSTYIIPKDSGVICSKQIFSTFQLSFKSNWSLKLVY